MTLLQAIELVVLLAIFPFATGLYLRKKNDSLLLTFVYGYIMQWSVFCAIAIVFIIKGKTLSLLADCTFIFEIIVSLGGIVFSIIKRNVSFTRHNLSKNAKLYLGLFIGILLFIFYKTVFYAFEDGDDSFYIATAQAAVSADYMYVKDPYIGLGASITYRYALAPFPMWISVIAKITGLNVAFLAHSILPPVLITISFIIFSEIAKLIYEDSLEKQYMLLCLLSVFELFSNVSSSTAATFLLTRSRQGKAALANIIIPLLFLLIYKTVRNELKLKGSDYLLLFFLSGAAALTSVFGNILFPIGIGFLLIYEIVKRKSFYVLFFTGLTLVPNVLAIALYVKYR